MSELNLVKEQLRDLEKQIYMNRLEQLELLGTPNPIDQTMKLVIECRDLKDQINKITLREMTKILFG